MGDPSVLLEASIYVLLLYFLVHNHAQTKVALLSWAGIYLVLMTGVKAGAKTLVIMAGNGWEIDSTRYQIDLFLVAIGLVICIFSRRFFQKKST